MSEPTAQEYREALSDVESQYSLTYADETDRRIRFERLARLLAHAAGLQQTLDDADLQSTQQLDRIVALKTQVATLERQAQKNARAIRVGQAALQFVGGLISREELDAVVLQEHAERQAIQ